MRAGVWLVYGASLALEDGRNNSLLYIRIKFVLQIVHSGLLEDLHLQGSFTFKYAEMKILRLRESVFLYVLWNGLATNQSLDLLSP